jgi:hypothetical protein
VGLHYFTWLPVMASLDNGTQSSPIFPSVAGCLGLLMLLAPLWRIWRERSLLVSGSLIRGEVAGTYHNKTISTYKVKYAAKDRSFQRTFIAFEATLRFHDYGPAIVVADPKRPGRACLYSDVSFWKAEV